MNFLYHPDFSKDLRRYALDYQQVYPALGERFKQEVRDALTEIKSGPQHAGHFLQTKAGVVKDFRRRNLRSFPFFVLYGYAPDLIIFGSIIPSHSDPLIWLTRFRDLPMV